MHVCIYICMYVSMHVLQCVPDIYTCIHIIANSQGIQRNNPGAVVDMLEHPLDQGKVCMHIHM